jgi:putative oxidoreductase
MAPASLVRKASQLGLKLLGSVDFVPGLLTRLVVGFAFYDSGGGKLKNMENTVNFFTDLGIPFPELNAAFVSRLEYYGGMLLLAGVLTRIVALLLSSTMIVALLTADRETFVGAFTRSTEIGLSDVAPFVLGVLLSWLVVKGPGALSVDALLRRVIVGEGENEKGEKEEGEKEKKEEPA